MSTGEIWAGRPAKLLRKMEEGEAAFVTRSAANYAVLSADHAIENAKTFPEVPPVVTAVRGHARSWLSDNVAWCPDGFVEVSWAASIEHIYSVT